MASAGQPANVLADAGESSPMPKADSAGAESEAKTYASMPGPYGFAHAARAPAASAARRGALFSFARQSSKAHAAGMSATGHIEPCRFASASEQAGTAASARFGPPSRYVAAERRQAVSAIASKARGVDLVISIDRTHAAATSSPARRPSAFLPAYRADAFHRSAAEAAVRAM